jgi:hypothetical protein
MHAFHVCTRVHQARRTSMKSASSGLFWGDTQYRLSELDARKFQSNGDQSIDLSPDDYCVCMHVDVV